MNLEKSKESARLGAERILNTWGYLRTYLDDVASFLSSLRIPIINTKSKY
ncbi:cation tolerance protein [Rickettsia sp. R2]